MTDPSDIFQEQTRPERVRPLERGEVADLILSNRGLIRRRVLGKLRATGVERIDPDDIFSSVLRRVDVSMLRGILRTSNEREFWAYVVTIVDNVTLDRIRAEETRRLHATDREQNARWLEKAFGSCRDGDRAAELLHQVLLEAPTDSDRELIIWRLGGAGYPMIAAATGRSEEAIRAQWSRLRRHLRHGRCVHG